MHTDTTITGMVPPGCSTPPPVEAPAQELRPSGSTSMPHQVSVSQISVAREQQENCLQGRATTHCHKDGLLFHLVFIDELPWYAKELSKID